MQQIKPFYCANLELSTTINPHDDGYKKSVLYGLGMINKRDLKYRKTNKNWSNKWDEYRKELWGKYSEFFIKDFARVNYSIYFSQPDISIDTPEQRKIKGHDLDLINSNIKIHIKSCRSIGKFKNSWVFDSNDRAITTINEDWLALTEYDGDNLKMYVRGIFPIKYLVEWQTIDFNIFEDPVDKSQRNYNRCVYAERLKEFIPESWNNNWRHLWMETGETA